MKMFFVPSSIRNAHRQVLRICFLGRFTVS